MFRWNGRITNVAWASLVALVVPALAAAQDQPPKANIVVAMSDTLRNGTILMRAGGGGGLQPGETGTHYLFTRADGSLTGYSSHPPSDTPPRGAAGAMGGVAGGVVGAAGPVPQGRPPLKYDYLWEVDVKPVSIAIDVVTFDLDWKRTEVKDDSKQVTAGDHRTITLRQGEKHLLDFIVCPADAKYANVFIDVQASPEEDPAVANLAFSYDLWLVHQSPEGAKVSRHLVVTGRQGEKVSFGFPAVPLALDTTASPEADSPFRLQVNGTITGRVRPDGTVEVALQSMRKHISPTGGGGAGGGVKTFVARLDETTSVDLPEDSGYSGWRAQPGFKVMTPRPGVSVDGDSVRVALKPFFEGSTTSLLVTVKRDKTGM